MPWPFQDREFVFRARIEIDREAGTFTAKMRSIESPTEAPETSGLVRGVLESSTIHLRSLPPDAATGQPATHVTVEIRADPKGNVPEWLVNLFQRDWPRKTLLGISAKSRKPTSVKS